MSARERAGRSYFRTQLVVGLIATVALLFIGVTEGLADVSFWVLIGLLVAGWSFTITMRLRGRK